MSKQTICHLVTKVTRSNHLGDEVENVTHKPANSLMGIYISRNTDLYKKKY